MNKLLKSIAASIQRCRYYIISILITYCTACLIGIIMVHAGNNFAVSIRDKLVGSALKNDKASINYSSGNHLSAALYDFSGNLFLGAVPQTALGLGIVIPYFNVLYQGWVGGIVSIDNSHKSRLNKLKSALYYFTVLFMQFIPYSLSIGAGIKTGLEIYKQNSDINWKLWKFQIKKENFSDIGYVYLVSIPLFFLASLFEFFSSWNI